MAVILDTCAFLAITGYGDKQLSAPAVERCENEELYVSAITAFEIGIKVRKGKLRLGNDTPRSLYRRICQGYRITELPLTGDLLLRSTDLADFCGDPFDCMILAEALSRSLDIATWDEQFIKYLAPGAEIRVIN